ncbi:MAG: type II secretion system F family protein [Chloroflexota bacterium]|jgi:tight adherence protein B|nr:type II secretion system F family protein [Chloroflexota bacterium]
MNPVLLIVLLIILAVMAAMIAIYRWLAWTREVEERLAESFKPVAAEVRNRRTMAAGLDSRLRRLSFAERLERQLAAADSNLSVSEFVMLRIGLALAGFLAGWVIAGVPAAGVPLLILGWLLPSFQLRRKQAKRNKDFGNQLPDMLSMLVGSLRAGYGLLHAISVVKDEMPAPIGPEFGRVLRETALGFSIGDALDHLVERVQNDDLALIVTAIHIQNEVGGSLAEVLETISQTIRERIQLKGEVNALTAQARITGSILTALPFLVGTALMLLNPEYMMGIFQPGWPLIIPTAAVIMVIFGNILMRKLTQIEY